jgi:hypothetical protein
VSALIICPLPAKAAELRLALETHAATASLQTWLPSYGQPRLFEFLAIKAMKH